MAHCIRTRVASDARLPKLARFVAPLAVLPVFAACGGGGGGSAPPAALAVGFATTAPAVAEGSGVHSFDVRLTSADGPITDPVTVTVTDIAFGGASSGSDYTAFAPVVLTFVAGSDDGDVQSVSIDVLDDGDVEAPEFVTLELSSPTGGAVVNGANRLTLNIADDEPKVSPFAFIRDASGVIVSSNTLATFGTTVMGASSAPLRIYVHNLGPSEFVWRPPVLTGASPGEFKIELVEVDGTPLPEPLPVALAASPSGALKASFPFLRTSSNLGVAGALVPDTDAFAAIAAAHTLELSGVPWPAFGDAPERELVLELEALPSAFASGAVVLEDGAAIDVGAMLSRSSLWTGRVRGAPLSQVFLGLSPHGSRGFIQLDPRSTRLHLLAEPLADASAPPSRLIFEDALPEGLRAFNLPRCKAGVALSASERALLTAEDQGPVAASLPTTAAMPIPGWVPSRVRLAIETDEDFFDLFGASLLATNYVNQLVASVSELFERHVETRFEIAYLQVYSGADPWTSPDSGGDVLDLLDEFRAAWAPSLGGTWPVAADLAHFLSGDNLGGGIAYVDVIGSQNFGFGVSADLTGSIAWGTFTGAPDPLVWDYVVLAHELGHGFGAIHTHEYCPPIDRCFAGCLTTTACTRSSLMSYCHLCPQGLNFVDPTFHALPANDMRKNLPPSIPAATLGADTELVFEVRFQPYVASGTRSARIDFSHNAPNLASPFMLRVEGESQ